MKEHYMLSRKITSSARFIKLSPSAQSLYMHLNSDSDDDGIVEAYTVMNKVRANETDFMLLVASGFVKLLSEIDDIAFITHWNINNSNRDIRYHKNSQYIGLLAQILPDVSVTVPIRKMGKNGKIKVTKSIVPAAEALTIINTNKNYTPIRVQHAHKIKQDKTSKDNNSLELLSLLEEKNQTLEYICPVCNGLKILEDKSICYQCNGSGYITYLKGR